MIKAYLTLSNVSLYDKFIFILKMYGIIQSGITLFSLIYITIISILAGLNLSLFVFYIKSNQTNQSRGSVKANMLSLGGMVSGFLGLGCAACGTFVLSSVLAFFGFGSILLYLPLDGAELGILAIILMSYGTYVLIRKIKEPKVCR